MPTALIINGAEARMPQASGRLNALLCETFQQELSPSHTILTTVIEDGYDIATEQRKFLQADLIIFQAPVFWFAVPASLKRYIDDIYAHGVFFGRSEQYGRGGLLSGKRYMLSTTWNAHQGDFSTAAGFLGERTVDDVFVAFHLTQQYVGLRQVASFSEHDVMRNPDPAGAVRRLQEHLKRYGVVSKREFWAA